MDIYFSVGNRKSTDESTASPAIKRRRADDESEISFNYSNISCNSTLNTSNQWEVRILKADLIEANTKVKLIVLQFIFVRIVMGFLLFEMTFREGVAIEKRNWWSFTFA